MGDTLEINVESGTSMFSNQCQTTLIFQCFSLIFNVCHIGIPCFQALIFNDWPNHSDGVLSGQSAIALS